jgi:hypothetical protein
MTYDVLEGGQRAGAEGRLFQSILPERGRNVDTHENLIHNRLYSGSVSNREEACFGANVLTEACVTEQKVQIVAK